MNIALCAIIKSSFHLMRTLALGVWVINEFQSIAVNQSCISDHVTVAPANRDAAADLVRLLESRGQVVSYPSHGLQWRLVEVRRLSVHHLDHHDAQRPDVHLRTHHSRSALTVTHNAAHGSPSLTVPRCRRAVWRWPPEPSSTAFPPETSSWEPL